jgi:hypothetical protein
VAALLSAAAAGEVRGGRLLDEPGGAALALARERGARDLEDLLRKGGALPDI